ncbi:hypothetical protein HN51_011013 [Arachis hypogaea]|uniref:Late embryogenesis abundant protein LEA-2 subgroup domain-containing protein n=2 Tax=Arachis TaxID=3817 RepID=A0A445E112_ARAHY|nr:uncharacterized protein LOC127745445 [Arachis duranensis]RYR69090.1 hypothetical protein Ahy_A03g015623 [Arachis hypogaea]
MTFESGTGSKSRRIRRCCVIVCAIMVVVISVIIVTLFLTVFRARDPKVSIHAVDLDKFDLFEPNVTTVPLGMIITITNPNYGTFYYKNSTGYLNYHEMMIAEASIDPGSVPARSTVNVSATAGVMSEKLMGHEKFFEDIALGGLNFTATATLPGKVVALLNIIKVKATVDIWCDVSFNITTLPITVASSCKTKIIV